MMERLLVPRTFVIVCGMLILLTVLTVGVSFMALPAAWHVILGLSIALVKGSLVVLFFMHLLASPRVTWIAVSVAGFWLLLLMVLLWSDYFTRNLVEFTPGH